MYLTFQQLVAPPPWAMVMSILIILGCDVFGCFLLKRLGLLGAGRLSAIRFQGVLVGTALLASILYPLALLQISDRNLMQVSAWVSILLGVVRLAQFASRIYKLSIIVQNSHRLTKQFDISFWLGACILLLLFLLALAPITNADALDYHIGVAVAILNQGGMPFSPEWFHSRLAGNGEVLNALALSVGAEQFGSLLQFASLLGIVGLILGGRQDDWAIAWRGNVGLICLAAISTPVLLFLVSAPKPQLWPVALTTFSFALMMHSSFAQLDRVAMAKRYALVCFLALTAMQAKFNYILGGGLAAVLGLFLLAQRGMWRLGVFTGLAMALIIVAPPMFWKSSQFSTNVLDALVGPLPGHWPGTEQFIASARNSSDFTSSLPFPLSIIIPSDLGAFSSVLGVGWLVFWGWHPKMHWQFVLGLGTLLVLLLVAALLAPPSARVYLEPYYWFMFLLVASQNSASLPLWVKWLIHGQAVVFLMAALFGVVALTGGGFSAHQREAVMLRSANGYELMKWVDETLPKDAVVLNSHRSMALLPREGVDASWMKFVDPKSPQALPYLERMRQRRITHILIVNEPRSDHPLAGCFGSHLVGPGMGRVVSRNPFNQGDPYQAWLLDFRADRLPDCANFPEANIK